MTEFGHGQIWWADLPGDKVRPVVVLTRDWIAPRLTKVLVAPVTTMIRGIPTEVVLGENEGLRRRCVVNLDNVQLLGTERLLEQFGEIAPTRWTEVCQAMAHTIGC